MTLTRYVSDITLTHYLLTFGSSCATLVLAFLLLGIRIPKQEELKKLRTARVYLSGAYFILAASGFSATSCTLKRRTMPC